MQTSNKELILLVDDDPGNLKRAQTILGEEFRISATTSGKMALSLLSKVTPDLILLDVNMPEMNGFETLKKIRELEAERAFYDLSNIVGRSCSLSLSDHIFFLRVCHSGKTFHRIFVSS